MEPASAMTRRLIIRNVVDLPQPEEPSKTQNSPVGIDSDKSSTTSGRRSALSHLRVRSLDFGAQQQSGDHPQQKINRQRQSDRRQSTEQYQVERVLAEPLEANVPSPPAPINAATTASPIVWTVTTRSPAISIGNASGNSIRQKICRCVSPTPRAASMTAGSTPEIPHSCCARSGAEHRGCRR